MDDDPATTDPLDALGDERCRAIVAALTQEPDGLSARALAERLDIPQSTMYRKLDRLAATPLVRQHATVGEDRGHVSLYRLAVDDLAVELDDGLAVSYTDVEGPGPDPGRP